MKKLYILLVLLSAVYVLNAQNIANYALTSSNTAYTSDPLATVANLSSGNMNDGVINTIDMGFDFWFMGTRYRNAGISTNGYIALSAATVSMQAAPANSFSAGSPTRPGIAPLWDDLDFTESKGQILYRTSGTAPNRVFMVEWQNAEWGPNTNDTVISFQVKLYETTGVISFHYQQGNAAPSGNSATIGIGSSSTSFSTLTNSGASPATNTSFSINNISTLPASGQLYTFTPPVPAAPTNISFTNTTINATTVNWTDNSSSETGYVVYRSIDNIDFYLLAQVGANVTSLVNNNLFTATTYYYRIYTISEGALSSALTGNKTTLNGGMSGNYSIPGNYATITAALNAIKANGVSGPVNLELQSSYNSSLETFPIEVSVLLANPPSRPITLRPANGVSTVSISGSSNPLINFNGAKNFVIDGRPGGTGAPKTLKIINNYIPPSSFTDVSVIAFTNACSNDTVRYCDLQGERSHIIELNSLGVNGLGNQNITIEDNNLHGGLSELADNLIYCYGQDGKEHNNIRILNNYLYDFRPQSGPSGPIGQGLAVIFINNYTRYTLIDGNHIYQPYSSSSFSSSYTINCIYFTGSGPFEIRNNYIGGSAPFCGGAAWDFGPSSSNNTIRGIFTIGNTNIENNTISNFLLSTSNGSFVGINTQSGIAVIKNNLIGSATQAGSITTNGASGFIGISLGAGSSSAGRIDSVMNNQISGIRINGGTVLYGIQSQQTSYIAGNTIGSSTLSNSILLTGLNNGQLWGINSNTPSTITQNLLTNISSTSPSSSSITGILNQGATVTRNNVNNLNAINSAIGISISSSSNSTDVSNNIIHSLSLSGTNGNITGINLVNGITGTDNLVSSNFIHSFDLLSGATASFTGIQLQSLANVNNNMIRLGIKPNGSSLTASNSITGIINNSTSPLSWEFTHNSIYIGGNNIENGIGNTYCLNVNSLPNLKVYNNIFSNTRSNQSSTGGGAHYIVSLGGGSSDNNIFFSGTAPFLLRSSSQNYSSFNAYKTGTSQDLNSYNDDPKFINPTGSATTVDLHLHTNSPTWAEGNGTSAYTLPTDFDGDLRTLPVDIGADAGNFMGVPVRWLSFEAKLDDNENAMLLWATASERNNSHFEIERSYDGTRFERVGTMQGKGTTNLVSRYSFKDDGINENEHDVFYRIRQVDFDGYVDFSEIRVLTKTPLPDQLFMYPNPASGNEITFSCAENLNGIEVYSIEGLKVHAEQIPQLNIYHFKHTLANGTYIVTITTKSGSIKTQKLVVAK